MVRKWLNISTSSGDYSADSDSDTDSDAEQGNFFKFRLSNPFWAFVAIF